VFILFKVLCRVCDHTVYFSLSGMCSYCLVFFVGYVIILFSVLCRVCDHAVKCSLYVVILFSVLCRVRVHTV